jgi:2-polyprenyl-3-methyl-5-hydroxy-6-metoxy-1,4-benzoquinol methylase
MPCSSNTAMTYPWRGSIDQLLESCGEQAHDVGRVAIRQVNMPTTTDTKTQRDFSLNSGERQVGTALEQIREDHLMRYHLALTTLRSVLEKEPAVILDVFCGNGYGTHLLSREFPHALCIGIDASAEAIASANSHYSSSNTLFSCKFFPFYIPPHTADAVVSFESLEHVEDDRAMIAIMLNALTDTGCAMISVPNEQKHSLSKNPHKFHYRHYTHSDLASIIPVGFSVIRRHSQDVYHFDEIGYNTLRLLQSAEMAPKADGEGQVSIYTIKRSTCDSDK